MEASEEQFQEVPDVGPVVASKVRAFFQEAHNRELIAPLVDRGVHWPSPVQPTKTKHPLSGKTIVITGILSSMTREEAKEPLQALGAKIAGSVSSRTDCVAGGDNLGSKARKAEQLRIATLNEEQLEKKLLKATAKTR